MQQDADRAVETGLRRRHQSRWEVLKPCKRPTSLPPLMQIRNKMVKRIGGAKHSGLIRLYAQWRCVRLPVNHGPTDGLPNKRLTD
jgi:hypothetical protein